VTMRALFVISTLGRGGSEGQLVELLARIHPAPVAATVATITTTHDRRHAERLLACKVPHVVLAPGGGSRLRRSAAAALRLVRLLRRLRPDVVYARGEYPTLLVVPLARLHGIPVMVARRNTGSAALTAPLDRAARWIEARAMLVTVNSVAVLEEAQRLGVPRERLRLVRNGHDPGPSSPPPPSGEEVRLGYVARLWPGKGHRPLLQALREVRANAQWRVELAGTGPLLEELRAEVREQGLAERVRFLGVVDDIPRFWQERSACLLLSESESSSNAVIEAGLAGRPLVVTDNAANRELVTPGSGIFVRDDDVGEMARRLEEIIDDAELREHLGRRARQSMQRFEMERMVAGHLDALEECCRGT